MTTRHWWDNCDVDPDSETVAMGDDGIQGLRISSVDQDLRTG